MVVVGVVPVKRELSVDTDDAASKASDKATSVEPAAKRVKLEPGEGTEEGGGSVHLVIAIDMSGSMRDVDVKS